MLGYVTGTTGQVDCWSNFTGCGELGHTIKLSLNPARQKLGDWLSRNPWDIPNPLLPQWRRQKSEVVILYTQQQDSRETCGGVTAGRTLADFQGVARTATDFGNRWLSGGSYSWMWWWEEAGVEAQAYPLPEGKGISKGRWKSWWGWGWNSTDGGSWEWGDAGMHLDPLTGCSHEEGYSYLTCMSLCSTTSCT